MGNDSKEGSKIKFVKIVGACIIGITISFIAILLFFIIVTNKYSNTAYKGIKISDIDVSFKNKEEIMQIINDTIISEENRDKLEISVDNNNYIYNYSELNGNYNIEKAAEEAVNYGKNFGIFKKFLSIKKSNNVLINVSYNCPEESIEKIISKIKNENDIPPCNASITIKDNNFEIKEGVNGRSTDENDLKEKIVSNLCYNVNEKINVKFNEVSPEITSKELRKITGIMGSFETDYSSSSYARSSNIKLVTNIINGTLLIPGDEFSYGEYAKKGIGKYEYAPGYVDGQVVNVEGGGICQPCTTLYRAVMKSNIKSVERHPHMYTVSYTRPGLDATLGDWGTLDYKFKNIYDFPIYIQGIAKDGIVRFNIYGDPAALKGYTYDMESNVYGLTAESYLVTFDSEGNEVKREFISEDTYRSH